MTLLNFHTVALELPARRQTAPGLVAVDFLVAEQTLSGDPLTDCYGMIRISKRTSRSLALGVLCRY